MNAVEALDAIRKALPYLPIGDPASDELINTLYIPDQRLPGLLKKLKIFNEIKKPNKKQRQEAGYLLEEILVLAFKGLAGCSDFKNFQSSSHQYDLLISGDSCHWEIVCDRLYLGNKRGILVEAKATEDPVSTAQFARLCSILSLNFDQTVGLGIFFTLHGASGFPKRGSRRTECVKYARLCQVLFHARRSKNIVVLDRDDIFDLDKSGALIQILIRKIKEIEALSGLPTVSPEEIKDIDLPSYLSQYL